MELFGVPRRKWLQNVRIPIDNNRALESRTSRAYVLPSSDQRTVGCPKKSKFLKLQWGTRYKVSLC